MRRCSVIKRLVLILMTLSLMPGWGFVHEMLDHYGHHGHFPHGKAHIEALHDGHERPHDAVHEHGCTPLLHTCGAHRSIPALVPCSFVAGIVYYVPLPQERLLLDVREPEPVDMIPPVPPPIAAWIA